MSLNPGQQTFEKMISGMYMGELVFIFTDIVIITWSTRLAETGKSGEARCGGHGRGGLDVPRPGHHHHQVHFVKTDAIFCKKFQFTIFHNTLEYSHNTLEYSHNILEYSHNDIQDWRQFSHKLPLADWSRWCRRVWKVIGKIWLKHKCFAKLLKDRHFLKSFELNLKELGSRW